MKILETQQSCLFDGGEACYDTSSANQETEGQKYQVSQFSMIYNMLVNSNADAKSYYV